MRILYNIYNLQTRLACLGEVTTNIAAWLGQGTGRDGAGPGVIPITHITLQHYIVHTPHTVQWPGQEETRQEQD